MVRISPHVIQSHEWHDLRIQRDSAVQNTNGQTGQRTRPRRQVAVSSISRGA